MRKQSQQIRSRNASRRQQELKDEHLELGEACVNIYDQPQFAAELCSKQFIDDIIDEGAKILYDRYLQQKTSNIKGIIIQFLTNKNKQVSQHTTDCMFSLVDEILRVEFRKSDKRFNDHSEIKENHIPKSDYDTRSKYVINIDKKEIIQEEEPETPQPQPISPYHRNYRTFYSTRNKLKPMSSTISEEMMNGKKKKPEHEFIPLDQHQQTNQEKIELKEEQKMRNTYFSQLKEDLKKKEQQKLRLNELKKMEDLKQKFRNELEGKNFTYDYDGQPLFFKKKKQNPDLQNIVCVIPYQVKTQKHKKQLDEIIENEQKLSQQQKENLQRINRSSILGNNQNEKAKRKHSSLSQASNMDQYVNNKNSIDSKVEMEEALKRKIQNVPVIEAQEVPFKQRSLKQNVQIPHKQIQREDIPDEVFNNGNMRQTTMIPYMTIREGVKLTEFQNGVEIVKLPEEKIQGEDDEKKKKQMSRNQYFRLIDESRVIEPSFRNQNNSRNTFSRRTIDSRENEDKEFQKQRVASLLLEKQANISENDGYDDKENSDLFGSINEKPEPIVIKDQKVKRKRIISQIDTSTQYKYNNINPNYFKNYKPNQQQVENENNKNKEKEDVKKKRSITHDTPSAIVLGCIQQIKNEKFKDNQSAIVFPVIPSFQKKKQAVLQDMYSNNQKVVSSKQRQRANNYSATNANSFINAGDYSSTSQNKNNITSDTFQANKPENQKYILPQYLKYSKYLNKSFEANSKQKKHSTTIVDQNQKDKIVEQQDKNKNIITFGKNEKLLQLLVDS